MAAKSVLLNMTQPTVTSSSVRALAAPAEGYGICRSDAFHYGYVFDPPFLTQQEGRYAGTPKRTLSGGQFMDGYSDHYPTYIILSK